MLRDSAYLKLVLSNRALLGFGFAMALASSFGQTYFIGVFGPSIQREFDLSHTAWGSVYLAGTLASAALLPWSGKLIDRLPLTRYALGVALLLVVACASAALAWSVASLVLAILLLRQAGQGLASHVAVTTMARYFDRDRGRAIAVVTLGFSVGEALLPVAAVAAIAWIGWRTSYAMLAAIVCVTLIPAILLTLRGSVAAGTPELATESPSAGRSWNSREVLRDARFFLMLPGIVAPALIITALFFHHLNLADAKGWSHAWITGNYAVFAASSTVVALACGPTIDRIGARRLVPTMLLPLAAGLVVVSSFDSAFVVWIYLVLIGGSIGLAHTAVTAMWAELYGVAHIGAIRSMVTAFAVFASALGPVALGGLMDSGVPIDRALLFFAAYALVASFMMALALRGGDTAVDEASC